MICGPAAGGSFCLVNVRDHAEYFCAYIVFSLFMQALEGFYDRESPNFIPLRTRMKEILQDEEGLQEIVQLVGKVRWSRVQPCSL